MKRVTYSSRSNCKPCSANIASSTSSARISLSTRTPSQSKMTAAIKGMSGRLAGAEELAHAAQRLENIFGGVGIGKPQIALAQDAEIRAPDQRHAGLVQHGIGQRPGH